MTNLAVKYLIDHSETIDQYDGFCGELVDALIHEHGEDVVSILYIDGPMDLPNLDGWSYHMVAVVDGLVHDAWFPKHILPPDEYLEAAFPGQVLTAKITGL